MLSSIKSKFCPGGVKAGVNLVELKNILEIFAAIATIVGVPIAILIFYQAKRREQLDREWGTYNSVLEEDQEFMRVCFENPDLDVLEWLPITDKRDPNAVRERREMLLYAIQLNAMERAYLMYRDQSTKVKKAQWSGWDQDMRDHATSPKWRERWKAVNWQMDADFTKYINGIILEQKIEDRQGPHPSSSKVETTNA